MFILLAFTKATHKDMGIRGVYSSPEQLRKAVDWWSGKYPNETLAYEEWDLDYPPEGTSWDWAYIPVGAKRELLKAGGGSVPRTRLFGKNLINPEDF